MMRMTFSRMNLEELPTVDFNHESWDEITACVGFTRMAGCMPGARGLGHGGGRSSKSARIHKFNRAKIKTIMLCNP